MFIKYKNYEGVLIYAEQIKGEQFKFELRGSDDVKISFIANMSDIRIKNCIGNIKILSEITK